MRPMLSTRGFGWIHLVVGALALLLARPCRADGTNSVLTPESVAMLRSVAEVAVSPDGRHVAFTRSVPRRAGIDEDGEPWSELWIWDMDAARERPYITGRVKVRALAWTPDGSQIGFLDRRRDDSFDSLYLIALEGGEARRALALGSDIAGFSLAPDGHRVAALAADPEDEAKKKLEEKGFRAEVFEEDWRFTRLRLGRLFDPASSNVPPAAISGSVRQVQWSPADDRLAVSVTPTPSVDDSYMRQQVLVVDATTNAPVRARVEQVGKLRGFQWSPDGRQIALIAGQDLHDPSPGRLLVVPATGGRPRDVLPGLEGEVTHVAWAGADDLLFVAARGVLSMVGRVGTAGNPEAWTNLVAPGHPILTGFSLSTDGSTAAFAGHSPIHPAELFTVSAGSTNLTRCTDSNPGIGDIRWAKQEALRYRARDGLDIEGILIHPLDEQAGTRYPLILTVHGGPESHVSDGWLTTYSLPGQVAAARGFAVFYPNYRGSTGRGVVFSKLSQGDPAGREFDDLVDGVDFLISKGIVDRQKVGVTGGSYGGYATAWCSTRYSERFAAGVMFVGISDKISKVGTTDIPDEEYYVHALKRPWEMWSFLLERSPIFHAAEGRTPLLILHGTDDPRVNPGQSRELYRHLKLRGQAPVRLVLYPGEGHGNRKAAARLDYQHRMLRWFEHYLKGPGGAKPPVAVDGEPSSPGR